MTSPHLSPVLVGFGEVLWDLLPTGRRLGGAPANVVCHAHALGAEAHLVSALGQDAAGEDLLKALRSHGLSLPYLQHASTVDTGTVSVTLDAHHNASYHIHGPVAWDHLQPSPALETLAVRADVVCFGTLAQRHPVSRQTLHWFLGKTRPDSHHLCDLNLREPFYDRDLLNTTLDVTTVLKLNQDEMNVIENILSLKLDEDRLIRDFMSRFELHLLVVTRGSEGSSFYTPEGIMLSAPSAAVSVVDTIGAGDAFTAVLALGLGLKLPLPVIQTWAHAVAGYVCTQAGATPELPHSLRTVPQIS